MLDFGSYQTASCSGSSRRAFIRTAAAVPAMMTAGLPALAEIEQARRRAKAKSVILLWLWEAPAIWTW